MRNKKLYSEHINEEVIDNKSTIYSCKTCEALPNTVNKLKASRHAFAHGQPKKRQRRHIMIYECSFCEATVSTKREQIEHYQLNHCDKGINQVSCTKCFKKIP